MSGPEFLNERTCQEAAQWYLDQGLRPIPWEIRGGTKVAAVDGFTYKDYCEASPGTIKRIIDRWQADWQVGLALAEPGGIFAVDVDSFDELRDFEEAYTRLPQDTWISTSGREDGGEHYLLRRSKMLNEWPRHGKFSREWMHLEVISNGLLAVPPSTHPSGRKYLWTGGESSPVECSAILAFWFNERQTKRGIAGAEVTIAGTANPPGRLELTGGVIPEGARNSALVSLAGSYRYVGHSADDIFRILQLVNERHCSPPVPDSELESIANWAAQKATGDFTPLGDDRQAAMAWVDQLEKQGKEFFEEEKEDTEETDSGDPRLPRTREAWKSIILRSAINGRKIKKDAPEILPKCDLEVAEFIDRRYRRSLTYIESDRIWRLWNGKTHAVGEQSSPAQIIIDFAKAYNESLGNIRDKFISDHTAKSGDAAEAAEAYKKVWGRHEKYREGIMNDPVQTRVLSQLKKRKSIAVTPDYFLKHADMPYWLNFENGTFDVREGELRPHNRDDRITTLVRRTLNMDLAKKPLQEVAPKFWGLLWRMCGAPGEISETRHRARASAVWRWSGYQCHGSNPEKKMAIFEGASNIGKNQLEEILADLLGPELAHRSSSAKLLVKTRGERHDSISNILIGRRMVLVNELSEQQVLDDQQILVLVNPEGTMVDLRHLHHDSVASEVTWKITVTTNQLARAELTPQVTNRLLILPLSSIEVPKEEQYDVKREIMEEEADAVLAHLVLEWVTWYQTWKSRRTGLIIPPDAIERLQQYRDENEHPAVQFIAERCRIAESAFVTHTTIWRMCEAYYKDQHSDLPTRYTGGRRKLFAVLDETTDVERVFQPNKRLRGFRGIEVLPPEDGSREQMNIWDTWTGNR